MVWTWALLLLQSMCDDTERQLWRIDENRQRLIDHPTALKTVLSLVTSEDLSMFAAATLQNLTLDNGNLPL